MYLTHLFLERFRRFVYWEHTFTPGVHVIVAENARGKTTLLEAAAYLSALASHRTSRTRELFNQPLLLASAEMVTRIRAGFLREDEPREQSLEVRWIVRRSPQGGMSLQREVLLNRVKRKAVDVLGRVLTVLFLPQMLSIVDGSPEQRRRYLNLTLAPVLPDYAPTLARYTHVLEQRNALLKQAQVRAVSPAEMDPWDREWARLAATLMWHRHQALQEWNALLLQDGGEALTQGEQMRLLYLPALGQEDEEARAEALSFWNMDAQAPALQEVFPKDRAALEALLLEQVKRRFPLERLRGHTTLGPHRDDFRFLLNGQDLTRFGSRGQMRNALLRLKWVEARWYRAKTGVLPVLLLDEIAAELDATRRQRVVTIFSRMALESPDAPAQVWMTSVEAEPFRALGLEMHLWQLTDTGLRPL